MNDIGATLFGGADGRIRLQRRSKAMFQRAFILIVLAAGSLIPSSGCLMTRTGVNVIRENEPRRASRFGSARAKQEFEARVVRQYPAHSTQSHRSIWVPLLVYDSRKSKLSENAYYNDQLASCDTDANGYVTDDEVAWYTRAVDQAEVIAKRDEAAKQQSIARKPLLRRRAHLSQNGQSDTLAAQPATGEGQNRR